MGTGQVDRAPRAGPGERCPISDAHTLTHHHCSSSQTGKDNTHTHTHVKGDHNIHALARFSFNSIPNLIIFPFSLPTLVQFMFHIHSRFKFEIMIMMERIIIQIRISERETTEARMRKREKRIEMIQSLTTLSLLDYSHNSTCKTRSLWLMVMYTLRE